MLLQGRLEIMRLIDLRVPFIGRDNVDVHLHADFGQFALDELCCNRVRVIVRRIDGEAEAIRIARFLQELLRAFRIIGIDPGQIDVPRICWWNERADQCAIVAPNGVQQLLVVDGTRQRLTNLYIVERCNAVVISKKQLGRGLAFTDGKIRIVLELSQRIRALNRGDDVYRASQKRIVERACIGEILEDNLFVFGLVPQ